MKVIVTGDSHTADLFLGQKLLEEESPAPLAADVVIRPLGGGHILPTPFFVDRGDHAEITAPQFRPQFARLPLDGVENHGTIYGICAPLHTARVWRHADWRRFAPIGRAANETPISPGMLRRVILNDQKYVLALIDVFVRSGTRAFAIEAPRPFRHHPALKILRPDVVLTVDRSYRDIMRAELDDRSIPIVSIPAKCLDEDGFTLEEYGRRHDPHHGNERFGRVMMLEVNKFLATMPG